MARRADGASHAVSDLRERLENRPLVLTSPGSVNWRTGGLSDPIDLTANSDAVWTIDTDHGRALLTTEIEAPRLEEDFGVREAGWDVLTIPWFDDDARQTAVAEYTGQDLSSCLSDTPGLGANARDAVVAARLVLSEAEREDLRELGSAVGRALGAGMDSWRPGRSTDFEVAAEINSALHQSGAHAVCLIVGGDARLRSVRHPLAIGAVVSDALMAVVVARRGGLHVAATRITVREPGDEILTLDKTLGEINEAVLGASLPGGTWGETVTALSAAYERAGHPGAWREHYQGGPIGFEQREFEISPTQVTSPFFGLSRHTHTAIAWNPSLSGGAKIEDTYLLGDSIELLSATPSWPTVPGPHGSSRSAVKVL